MSTNLGSEKEKPAAAGREPGTSPSPGDSQPPADGQNGEAQLAAGKPRLRARYHYLAFLGIALFLVWWDPFQWNEASSNASQDLAYRVLIGPLYPTDQRDEITVVLFNEATLG